MSTLSMQARTSLLNILLLTGLTVGALLGTMGAIFSLVTEPATQFLGSDARILSGVGTIAVVQLLYLGFAWHLSRQQAPAGAAMRYALALQLQALIDVVVLAASWSAVAVFLYFMLEIPDDQEFQDKIIQHLTQYGWLAMQSIVLALPAVTMLLAAWVLHGISSRSGALASAVSGSFLEKHIDVTADVDDVRRTLAKQLERLTDKNMPGLGRFFYGSHPTLLAQDIDGSPQYQLVWSSCPSKLLVTVEASAEGRQRIVVRCVQCGGFHRIKLFAEPIDVLVMMQYIEAHLLVPVRIQLQTVAAERQRDALRQRAVETQLRILQAQIEPHFLFNTLANVRHLYRSSIEAGEDMLDHLIAYLRSAMDDLRAEDSTVVREMDLAMHYLAIMKIRMGERLSYRFILPDELLEHPFPPAMLISLVENAIKHGIAGSERGEIVLSASRQDGQLRLRVADNGAGLSSVGGTGVGLANIRQRLEAMFGSAAWLEVGAEPDAGFTATIVIPLQERKE